MNPITANINTSKPWYQFTGESGLIGIDIRPLLAISAVVGFVLWQKFK